MKQVRLHKLTKLIIIVTLFLSILQVVAANRVTTSGLVLGRLTEKKDLLEKENQSLEVKIAGYSSLAYTTAASVKAGFKKPQILFLKPVYGVALKTDVAY